MSAQVLAAQAGDREAFAGLVRRWQGAVCAIGLAILRDVAASEDLAQEVFLAAWQGLARLQDPDSFGPWVRQLTRYKALDRRRSGLRYAARVVLDGEAVERAGSASERGGEEIRSFAHPAPAAWGRGRGRPETTGLA